MHLLESCTLTERTHYMEHDQPQRLSLPRRRVPWDDHVHSLPRRLGFSRRGECCAAAQDFERHRCEDWPDQEGTWGAKPPRWQTISEQMSARPARLWRWTLAAGGSEVLLRFG